MDVLSDAVLALGMSWPAGLPLLLTCCGGEPALLAVRAASGVPLGQPGPAWPAAMAWALSMAQAPAAAAAGQRPQRGGAGMFTRL
jgi:hypothetical protein